jgi:hypothetical protein
MNRKITYIVMINVSKYFTEEKLLAKSSFFFFINNWFMQGMPWFMIKMM